MRWQPSLRRRFARIGVLLAFALVTVFGSAADVRATERIESEESLARIQALKSLQVRLNQEGAQRRRVRQAEYARAALEARRKGLPLPAWNGKRAKKAIDDDIPLPDAARRARLAAPAAVNVIPPNVRANDPAGDVLAGSGQSESSIASFGQNVLVAWNDGDGFGGGSQAPHVQGYGYSTDGGATFTDGGTFPIPGGSPQWVWTSDPVVTVNEATGEFWYCGLISPTPTTNGIGVVRGTFGGGTINWDTPVAAVSISNFSNFTDKQWIVADSSNGNLYISYTDFFSGGNHIRFIRSTDGGATWSAPMQISGASASGRVQGSRPAVGPDGEVYVVWKEIGTTALDLIQTRKSVNDGVSFAGTFPAAMYYDNFGTGAPGFNRERAVSFPSIDVDRTTGTNRGRVYVAFHESFNFYDDGLGGGIPTSETESNNSSGTADPFTPGGIVRGTLTSGDQDWFSFNAVAGTDYLFWADSIPNPLYSMRIFCSDAFTRLAFAGALSSTGTSFYTWTAPTTATYYLRMFWVSGAGTGGYRILTGINGGGPERGRDHRDVFVTTSDDGASWTVPKIVNNDAAWFDNWLPEVRVGSDGCPYAMWFDWRDAVSTCGGLSHIYVSRSTNGGTTWEPNVQATNLQSDWTSSFTNIAPNQGDYSHMYGASDFVRWTWADVRSGNADTYVAGVDTRHSIVACQGDTTVTPNDNFSAHFEVQNPNGLFGNDYTWTMSDQRGWPLPNGNASAAAASNTDIEPSITVPDTAAAGDNIICIDVTNDKGTIVEQCCFTLTASATVSVPGNPSAFSLAPVSPNPSVGTARIAFTLPANGNVKLRVFGLRGERVRTLASGEWGAGSHSVVWDGLNDGGRRVGPGTYFVRLEGFGQQATERFVFVR